MLSTCTPDSFEDAECVWKVLIYDTPSRDILAPLLSVAELRAAGVTLHMLISKPRNPIPDVPAIYFIEPTVENINQIITDASTNLYNTLWINFSSCAPRHILEKLAEGLSISSTRASPSKISRVYDMYTHFHALQHNLFSLELPDTYAKLNAVGIDNAEVEALVARIVDRLFFAVLTLGTVPLIRAQTGGPAYLVAKLLTGRLREHLKATNNAFVDRAAFAATSTERPLLVILDRATDVPVMLHHTWTYQALAHDVLGLSHNRIALPVKEGDKLDKRKFDLGASDEFWTQHAGQPFPMVADAVESALRDYKKQVSELSRSTNTLGDAQFSDGGGTQADVLAEAVSNIPELGKKKRVIDLHTNIATALLDEIKERGLDGYFQVEEELLTRPGTFDVERILLLLRGARGDVMDKFRLFLIYFLCVDAIDDRDLNVCMEALRQAGCDDFRAFRYLQSIRAFTRSVSTVPETPLSASSSLGGAYAASVLDTLSQVANNVNKLILSGDKALTTAKDVSALMEAKEGGELNERYVMFDPKAPVSTPPNSRLFARGFQTCILFVVGPGNYVEFQNCQDHVCSRLVQDGKRRSLVSNGKTVVYGATEMCRGSEFIEQLASNGSAEAT